MVKEIKAGILVLGIICFACGCGRTETAQTEAMTENVRKINTEAVEENLTQVINNIRTEDVNRKKLLSDTGFISWEEAGLEAEAVDWKDAELEENIRKIIGIYNRPVMLSDVWELTSINLARAEITDASALGMLRNLEELNMRNSSIENIEFISGLPRLRYLDVSGTSVSSISSSDYGRNGVE